MTRAERRRTKGHFFREGGEPCDPDDPKRLIWYSVACTYWTDDWDHVRTDTGTYNVNGRIVHGGPPTCPKCGAVGFQGEFGPWLRSAQDYEDGKQPHDPKPHPDYVAALLWGREQCLVGGFEVMIDKYHADQRRLQNVEKGDDAST